MTVPPRFLPALILCAAVAAFMTLATATSSGAEEKGPKNSAALAKPLKEANDDLKAHKYAEAIAKLKAAEGMSGKTPEDQYLINEMLSFAYIKTQNYTEAAKAIEAKLDSGLTPPSEERTLVEQLAAILSATAASSPASSSGHSTAVSVYGVTYVGMPVTGSCEPVSQRTSAALDRALAHHEAGRVLSARCVPFGGDPDSWLVLDVLVSDKNATLPTIASTLRELGASPKTEISFDSTQPQQDSVTVVLGRGALGESSEQGARSLDSSSPRHGPAEGDSVIDIGSSRTEGRQVLKFKTGDVFLIHVATGESAAVQFVVTGIHDVEYRFRYRPKGSESLVSGHDHATERYRIERHDADGDHLSELPGHDVTLRIGELRAEWSSAGAEWSSEEADEGFVYYDPAVATIRKVKGIDFDKLP